MGAAEVRMHARAVQLVALDEPLGARFAGLANQGPFLVGCDGEAMRRVQGPRAPRRARALRRSPEQVAQATLRVEGLDAPIRSVGDEQATLAPRQPARFTQEARPRARAAEARQEATLRIELGDAVVAQVGDVDVAPSVDRNVDRLVQLALAAAALAEREHQLARQREGLHAMVARVGDVQPVLEDRQATGSPKAAGHRARAAERAEWLALGVEDLHAVVAGVGHEHAAIVRERDAAGLVQLARPRTGSPEALHDRTIGREHDDFAALGVEHEPALSPIPLIPLIPSGGSGSDRTSQRQHAIRHVDVVGASRAPGDERA